MRVSDSSPKPTASSPQEGKQTGFTSSILNIHPSDSLQSPHIHRESLLWSTLKDVSVDISHLPSDPTNQSVLDPRAVHIRRGQLLSLYPPTPLIGVTESYRLEWSGMLDHVARFRSEKDHLTSESIVDTSAASSVEAGVDNERSGSTLPAEKPAPALSASITPSPAGVVEQQLASPSISCTTPLVVSASRSTSPLNVADKQLAEISVQVNQLAIASQDTLHDVHRELERNRTEVAQTRGEVYTVGKQVVETSQLDKRRSNINRLPIAPGASYDASLGCMEGTRTSTIGEIIDFSTKEYVGELRVLLLTGFAGSGKTAIAHSVARICDHDHHCLGGSFFFRTGETHRDRPHQLISTICRELSARNPAYASQVSDAIEANPSITHAPLINQFQTFLLLPTINESSQWQPTTIVIDAIDEGWSEDLFRVITLFSKLPSWFRIFITLRDDGMILPRLRSQTHIRRLELDITAERNFRDIEVYVSNRLRAIATDRELGDWPTTEVVSRMCSKANGLFVWAAVACNSIADIDLDPMEQYEELVGSGPLRDTRASSQMDDLYMKVLSKCHLHDTRALSRYHQSLGTLLTLMRPLSIDGLVDLLDEKHVPFTLRPFSAVVRGLVGPLRSEPVQIIHQSFREFLTQGSANTSFFPNYIIVESEHHEALTLRCLAIIRKEMPSLAEDTRWITDMSRELESSIPVFGDGVVSEGLWYACEYVGKHNDTVTREVPGLSDALRQFMREDLYGWLAVCTMKGNCQDIGKMQNYMQRIGQAANLIPDSAALAQVMQKLSYNLKYDNRFEEALLSATMSVAICREAGSQTEELQSTLGGYLNNLSNQLSDRERHKDALAASLESSGLYRDLARKRPATFGSNLAASLHNLSIHLSTLGHQEEALAASLESVSRNRDLARNRPAAFNSHLARSLHALAYHLPGDRESMSESITVCQEAELLYRTLAEKAPLDYCSEWEEVCGLLLSFEQLHGDWERKGWSEIFFDNRRLRRGKYPQLITIHD